MTSLKGTPFSSVYTIVGVEDDTQLINRLSAITGVFILLIIITKSPFKYGKIGGLGSEKKRSEKDWVFSINSRIAWMVGLLPHFIVPVVLMLTTPSSKLWNFCNLFGIIHFILHYFNRSIIYSSKIAKDAKSVQLPIFLMMFLGSFANGFLQSHFLLNVQVATTSPISYFGIALAISGMAINIYHDNILTKLRDNSSGSKTTTGYKIPRGGLFEYVSCANFSGEIIEWWGYALLCGGLPPMLQAVHATVFLGSRAFYTHNFYRKTFGKAYPTNRQIIIPYIF